VVLSVVLLVAFKAVGPMTGLSFGFMLGVAGPSTGLASGLVSFLYIINIRFEFEFKRGFNDVVYIDLIFFAYFLILIVLQNGYNIPSRKHHVFDLLVPIQGQVRFQNICELDPQHAVQRARIQPGCVH